VTELLENHSQPLTNEEVEDLTAQLTEKQQQQEQEEAGSLSIETHDLQQILAGTDRYPQRLGNIDPGSEQSCSIGSGVSTVSQLYEASS
jgi:hypothetical protein